MTSAAPATETTPRTFRSVRPIRPTRGELLELLTAALPAPATGGGEAAWQGPVGAPRNWRYSTGAADLDIWCDPVAYHRLDDAAARASGRPRPARRRPPPPPALLLRDRDERRPRRRRPHPRRPPGRTGAHGARGRRPRAHERGRPASVGHAAAADLFVRPLLRGRIVDDARLAQARAAWAQASQAERSALIGRSRASSGAASPPASQSTLDGATPDKALVSAARKALDARLPPPVRPRLHLEAASHDPAGRPPRGSPRPVHHGMPRRARRHGRLRQVDGCRRDR